MFRRFLGAWLVLAGVALLAIAQESLPKADPAPTVIQPTRIHQPLSERGVLVAVGTTGSAPYSFVDEKGVWTGFVGDLLSAVVRVTNLPVTPVLVSSDQAMERFHRGEFDFIAGMTRTAEREKFADFTRPFLNLRGAVFVHTGGPPIRRLADLHGRRFATLGADSIAEQLLQARGIDVEVVLTHSVSEAFQLVDSGECAGVFTAQMTGLYAIERGKLRRVAMLDENFPELNILRCFAVHKGDAELLARLNEGLAILEQTGEFNRIYNRWFTPLSAPLIRRDLVVTIALWTLGIALLLALGVVARQRALHRQITRQAEQAATQQALLNALFDHVPLAMCVLEQGAKDLRVLAINRQAEALFGVPAGTAAGRPLAALRANPEWSAQLQEVLQRSLATADLFREERQLKATNRRMVFTVVPMAQGAPDRLRFCLLAEDVTERRNIDDEIARSRKLRAVGELVGGIAHEFNNLLTPIMLKVGQIRMDWAHDAALVAESRLITEAVRRSAELTQRLLTFGRKTDHLAEEIRLSAAVTGCIALLRLTMDRRIVLENAVPADLPPIFFNGTDLNQIVLNMVINARDTLLEKLAGQRGEWTPLIRIEARLLPPGEAGHIDGTPQRRKVHGWQRLTIRDNGMGMPPEVRERIFEPFFTTKDIGKGTGLGLATVWHLVTEISGRIEVESTPGQGTAFHIYLPMLSPTARTTSPHPPAAVDSGPARIFFAEDDTMVSSAVISALQRAGHSVVHHADGATAWHHLQSHAADYDLLLLDINMPGLDGIELARRARATGTYAGPILIVSGRLGSDDLAEIAAAKVDRVLSKPFDVPELLEAVKGCLHPPTRR